MGNLISRIKSIGKVTDEENFENHIKQWFPIAILIGIIVGMFMAVFYVVIILLGNSFRQMGPILTMLVGGIIIIILHRLKFEIPSHNGISYVISKRHQEESIPLDVGAKKFVTSGITIASGLPVGREGPALIIGSAIAGKIVDWANIPEAYRHQAITLGSAASTGALFQAPFGSAVFSAEVPYKEDSDEPMLMAAFLASVIAAVTSKSLVSFIGNYIDGVQFHLLNLGDAFLEVTIINSFYAILLGGLIGIVGRIFIIFYYWYTDIFLKKYSDDVKLLIGFSIFLLNIGIALIVFPDLYLLNGISAFAEIEVLVDVNYQVFVGFLILSIIMQIIATTAIIGSGFPGGIFAPSLLIGALVGILFAELTGFHQISQITAWVIIGMSGSHAAMTKTPVASVLLILEITNLPNLIIPMVLVNICAYIVSGPKSLYAGQLRSRDAAILAHLKQYDQHEDFNISDVMTPLADTIFFNPEVSMREVLNSYEKITKREYPITRSKNDLTVVGMLRIEDFKVDHPDQTVNDIFSTKYIALTLNLNGKEALANMLDQDVERAPVVDENNQLIGIVSIGDIIRGHQNLMELMEITSTNK